MNRIFSICALILGSFNIFSQVPERMSYQAVVRNSSDQLVKNTNLGIQISIIQGSISGTAVYIERQYPTTNANGLVSVEIGNGTVVSGIFTDIDWAQGEYFLKTETDLNGGSNYTIVGTSQLLSVPYALYAKTAENGFSGNYGDLNNTPTNVSSFTNDVGYLTSYTEVDGSVTNEIQVMNISNDTIYLSNSGFVKLPAGFSGNYDDLINKPALFNGTWDSLKGKPTIAIDSHFVGEKYGGGIVAYTYDHGRHGLIAAPPDQVELLRWGPPHLGYTMAMADGIGAGRANTAIIIARQGFAADGRSYAARACNEYSVTIDGITYGDWYLPSKFELNLLYLNKDIIGGFILGHNTPLGYMYVSYWSSTESGEFTAWGQYFMDGLQREYFKWDIEDQVHHFRAVRTF